MRNTPCTWQNNGDHFVKVSYGYCGLSTFPAVVLCSSSQRWRWLMDIISLDQFGFRLLVP